MCLYEDNRSKWSRIEYQGAAEPKCNVPAGSKEADRLVLDNRNHQLAPLAV